MEDLSHLFSGDPISALVPTTQESAGSQRFTNERAMAAPGGEPAALAEPVTDSRPDVDATEAHRAVRPVLRIGAWNDLP